ncbi:4'-phosphopantetheinyl transferase superfamily protein [Thiotrichales bacterium 19S3-7]|nr:4'-phosphopantetheinyl transferase superfamily protein [Thiotrichales bacterium 19S3-7]MCF6802869.1 4'-phosphopantetheinyl transferase superfamily protein [Thiotrichales bacterium 19S3-11]
MSKLNLYMLNLSFFKLNEVSLPLHVESKLKEFKSEKRKLEYAASRWLRYHIFSELLRIDQAALVFSEDDNLRPFLVNDKRYDFNISHSGNWLMMAVIENGKVGIDIEKLDDTRSNCAIAEAFFSQEEAIFLNQLASLEQLAYFYLIWTLKEARLKCTGEGIANGLKEVIFSFKDRKILPKDKACLYQYISFRLDQNHLGSICLKSDISIKQKMINCYQIQKDKNSIEYKLDVIKQS